MPNETITRAHLMNKIYQKLGFSRAECSDLVDAVFEEINNGMAKEGEVKISLFGTFAVKHKKPRVGRNPKTMKEVVISERNVISFIPSNILKKRINNSKT